VTSSPSSASAVDSFYVCDPAGRAMDPERRRRVEVALTAAARGVPAGAPAGAGADRAVAGKADTPD
jgi:[protein-PII] uridylyltransferase